LRARLTRLLWLRLSVLGRWLILFRPGLLQHSGDPMCHSKRLPAGSEPLFLGT
jgi:hypothetical protein